MIYAVIQIVVVTLVVAFSLAQVARKVMPQTARRVQARLARSLRKPAMPALAHAIGERIQPEVAPAKGCGNDTGCGSCNMCGTIAALSKDVKAVR